MNKSVLLQPSMYTTLDDKINKTNGVLVCDADDISNIINSDEKNEYHEFIITDDIEYTKIFFDIDIKSNLKLDLVDKLLRNFKRRLVTLLHDFMSNNICSVNPDDYDIKKFINKNTYVTISNDPNKFSIHIFVDCIYINVNLYSVFRHFLIKYIKKSKDSLISNIDPAVYKKNTTLRLIYATKPESSYMHIPYDISNGFIDKENVDIDKYLFSYVDPDSHDNYIMIDMNPNDEIQSDLCTSVTNRFRITMFRGYTFISKFLEFLTSFDILLNNTHDIMTIKNIDVGHIIDLQLTYDECYCKKKPKHTHNHILKFNLDGIALMKSGGNYNNCKVIKFSYPNLNLDQITDAIASLDIFRKYEDDEYLYWNGLRWCILKDNGIYYQISKEELLKVLHHEDYNTFIFKFFNCSKQRIVSSISTNKSRLCDNPYIIQFTNGVYDMLNDIFIRGDEAKQYITIGTLDCTYIDKSTMTNDERDKLEDEITTIKSVIDLIIPPGTKKRKVFEVNIGSVLLNAYKPVITIFYGPTSSGKSTIFTLISALLGIEKYVRLPMQLYKENLDSYKPHACAGKINNKLCSRSSEVKEGEISFSTKNIKDFTEPIIDMRLLNSNNQYQINKLTQLIDMNPEPTFDNNQDEAIMKRLAIIHINNAFFAIEKKATAVKDIILNKRLVVPANNKLREDIIKGKYKLATFYILLEYVHKYHKDNIDLLATPSYFLRNKNMDKVIQCNSLDCVDPGSRWKYTLIKIENKAIVCRVANGRLLEIGIKKKDHISHNQ